MRRPSVDLPTAVERVRVRRQAQGAETTPSQARRPAARGTPPGAGLRDGVEHHAPPVARPSSPATGGSGRAVVFTNTRPRPSARCARSRHRPDCAGVGVHPAVEPVAEVQGRLVVEPALSGHRGGDPHPVQAAVATWTEASTALTPSSRVATRSQPTGKSKSRRAAPTRPASPKNPQNPGTSPRRTAEHVRIGGVGHGGFGGPRVGQRAVGERDGRPRARRRHRGWCAPRGTRTSLAAVPR